MSKRKHWALVCATGFLMIAIGTVLYALINVAWENQTELLAWVKNHPKFMVFFGSLFGMLIALGIGNDLS